MSYEISLNDPVTKEPIVIEMPHFMYGGNRPIHGSHELSLKITYKYYDILQRVIKINNKEGIRAIYGLTALEVIPILESAINMLNDDVSNDYWEPTEGNVKKALIQVLTMSKMRPDGIWDGD